MREGLNDDIVFIDQNDVSVTKQFNAQGALTIFCIETEQKNTIEAKLFNLG